VRRYSREADIRRELQQPPDLPRRKFRFSSLRMMRAPINDRGAGRFVAQLLSAMMTSMRSE
jgi:hypothetical protein